MSIDLTGVCNGDYYVVSVTDPDNNFFEQDETNNWCATPITLTQQIPAPVGSFTYSVSGSNVQFTNSASVNYTYQWYFGDGGNSTNQNPSHLYTAAGVYNVTMIVFGPCGSDTTTQIVTITTVGIEESASAAMGFSAYPNPISENTIVSYFLNEKSNVTLELYNTLGQKVNSITRGVQAQGFYEFNYNMKALNLENGVYILQIKTETQTASIRLSQLD
jgi:PKD repeat protein